MDVASQQATAEPNIKAVATWLRNKSGIKWRTGILDSRRVDYLKGRSAVKALLTPAYTKLANKNKANLYPKVENEEEAQKLLSQLNRHAFYLKIERGDHVIPQAASSAAAASSQNQSMVKQPRLIRVDRMQGNAFEQDGYYMWCIEGSQLKTILGAIGLVTVVLAGCMFPLWPTNLRIGVWYLSIGILGLIGAFFGLSIFRLVFWLFTKVAMKPGIWIFPKLFDDVGFVESFIPGWDWDLPPPKKTKKKRKTEDGQPVARNGEASDTKTPATKRKVTPAQQRQTKTTVEDAD